MINRRQVLSMALKKEGLNPSHIEYLYKLGIFTKRKNAAIKDIDNFVFFYYNINAICVNFSTAEYTVDLIKRLYKAQLIVIKKLIEEKNINNEDVIFVDDIVHRYEKVPDETENDLWYIVRNYSDRDTVMDQFVIYRFKFLHC